MAKQFRYDLVIQCLTATMDTLTEGVRIGMSRDEILLFKARLNHEIDRRLLEAEMVAITILDPNTPGNGPKH